MISHISLERCSFSSFSLTASTVLLCPIILCLFSLYHYRALRKYNGPLLATVTDLYKYWHVRSRRDQIVTVDWHRRYGSIVRIGPSKLSFSDPKALKDIYGINKGYVKSGFYSVAAGVANGRAIRSLFSILDESYHAKLRRAVNSAFSLSTLVQYEPFVNSTIQIFLNQLEERFANKSGSDGVIDWPLWLQYYAFDVIGELTYSERHGFLEEGRDVDGIIAYLGKYMSYLGVVGTMPMLDKFFWKNPILMWLSRQGIYDNSFPVVPFAKRHMARRLEAERQGKSQREQADFLSKFMQAQKERPEVVGENEVLAMCMTMVFAGSETTAVSLSGFFYHLLQNPSCLAKLQEEIDTQLPASNTHTKYYETSFADIQKLQYLDACVKEAFRMHPAPGFDMERIVPPGGAVICGEHIPEGTTVSCNAWVIHKDEGVFGEDAEIYRPERWLEDGAQARVMANTLFQFGQGSRTCIGKNISTLEMYKLIPAVLKTFEISLDEVSGVDCKWKLHNDTFVKPSNFNIRIKIRA